MSTDFEDKNRLSHIKVHDILYTKKLNKLIYSIPYFITSSDYKTMDGKAWIMWDCLPIQTTQRSMSKQLVNKQIPMSTRLNMPYMHVHTNAHIHISVFSLARMYS